MFGQFDNNKSLATLTSSYFSLPNEQTTISPVTKINVVLKGDKKLNVDIPYYSSDSAQTATNNGSDALDIFKNPAIANLQVGGLA
jgi:hypothetical protein